MSSTEFRFPAMHDFPPVYTRQPTEATWRSQVAQWSDLILSYTRHHRIFRIDLHEATVPGGSELFQNPKIKRRLSFPTLQEIIDEMVKQGTAEWEGGPKGPKAQAWIYWKKPEDWANAIWNWVNQRGMNNDIVTVYEIAHGDMAEGEEFYEMDKTILIKALNVLVKRGVAQIFKGSSEDDMGRNIMNWDSPSKPTNVLSLSISRKRKLLEAAAKQASSVDNPHSSSSKKIAATISEDLRKSTNDRPKSHSPDIERMDDDDMDGSFWQQVIDIEQKVRLPESERIDADVDIASNDACEHVPNMQQDCTVSTDNVEMTTPMLASLSVSDPGRKQKKLVGEDVFTRSSVKEWQAPRIKAWEGRYLNPEGYYYRFVVPGEGQRNGGWSREEHKLFMERYNEWISRGWKIGASWGLFSKEIPHRVGYQCMNYYRKLVSERKLQDESYAIIDGKLKQIHKDRAPGGEIPTTDLGSEWDGEDVKEVERNVDLWLKEFHNRSGSAAVRSIAAPKPKAAPRVAKTITGKKSNIGDLVKKQKPATVIDGDDDFMMESMEPEQVQLNGSNYDWEKDWNERLDKLREFMRPYLDKETREAYWHAKQHWRQGLATTEMLLMKKPIQKSVASTEGNDHSKAVARTQASLSRFFTGVKKAKVDTPDEMISNVRIPNDLYSGVRQITPFTVWKSRQINEERVHYYELEDMMDCTSVLESLLQQKETDLSHSPLEGILVDPPWEFYINDGRNDGRCSWNLKTMATLLEKVVDQMSAGLVFIWTHKLIQADVVRMMSSINCRYVENLVWFKKSINNVPLDQPSPYISSTKEILLMFKKGDGFELRHQRTADVIIDFELPRSQWIHQEFTEPKPLAVYDMIETLLPKAGYDEQLKRGRLLELWAKSASPRREGWIAFHQKKHVQQTTNEPMSIADP